jgi:plasmid stabilization system protein ParE
MPREVGAQLLTWHPKPAPLPVLRWEEHANKAVEEAAKHQGAWRAVQEAAAAHQALQEQKAQIAEMPKRKQERPPESLLTLVLRLMPPTSPTPPTLPSGVHWKMGSLIHPLDPSLNPTTLTP